MKTTPKHEFTGVWFPASVWKDTRLTANEKFLLMDIAYFTNADSTWWKSNAVMAEQMQCSTATIKRAISKLMSLGYVEQVSFNGRVRKLRALLGADMHPQRAQECAIRQRKDAPAEGAKMHLQTAQDCTPSNNIEQYKKKTKENKVENPFGDDAFAEAWTRWKEYKRAEHKFTFKSPETEKTAIKRLHNDTEGNTQAAISAIDTSIANGWKGLFPERVTQRDKPSDLRATTDWASR